MANVFIEESTLTAIGDAIRAKTGGTEGILPADMPAQIEGISGGGDGFYDTFWDAYQSNGARTEYGQAFGGVGWTNTAFKPKYDMTPTSGYMMFRGSKISGDLPAILSDLGVSLNTSNTTDALYMFSNTQFTHLGVLDFSQSTTSMAYYFQGSSQLITIDELHLNPTLTASKNNYIFSGCKKFYRKRFNSKLQGFKIYRNF